MTDHIILGAGPIARATATALLDLGIDVTLISRSGRTIVGADSLALDVHDRESLLAATRSAHVIYHTLNPAYTRWKEDFPPLQDAAIAAARNAQARLVVMDNVYAYGAAHPDAPFTEDSPIAPNSGKGMVRARLATQLWQAHERGDIEAVSGHASDYFGADAGSGTMLGTGVFTAASVGKPVKLAGNVNTRHSYAYLPDIGTGLALLGTHADAAGTRWHLPHDPSPWTTRDLVNHAFRIAGQKPRVRVLPSWAFKVAGVVVPFAKELAEMSYEFDADFIVSSAKLTATFGTEATPTTDAVEQIMQRVRDHH